MPAVGSNAFAATSTEDRRNIYLKRESCKSACAWQVLAELQRAQLIHIVVGPEGHPADIGEVHGTEKKQTMLRLNSLAPNSKLGQPLNAAFPWFGPARPANKVRCLPACRYLKISPWTSDDIDVIIKLALSLAIRQYCRTP